MSSDGSAALRRLLARLDRPLRRRRDEDLPFATADRPLPARVVLDTTVYIDQFHARLPPHIPSLLTASLVHHCAVTEAEILGACGQLDPQDARTPQAVRTLTESVERRPKHRCLAPDRDVWRRAGVIAGRLSRVQGHGKDGRHRLLNDALIFLTAAKAGACVLTRNIGDFDLLMQIEPKGSAIFYRAI